ncbi:MAG: hypothetical protein WCP03_01850 [Candidatus Saccharibacteria bacterium]
MKAWYAMTDKELANFFDVDMSKGLSGQSVIARLDKFGLNNDPSLSHEMQEIYKAWVKRDGRIECIAIKYIVPGDIVLLDTGSRVPADLRLLHVHQLGIDQSLITGEALPATKSTFAIDNSQVPIEKQNCMAFAGTYVTRGSGWGIVVNHADKMQKSYQKADSKTKKNPLNLTANRLKRLGIAINNKNAPKLLNDIDFVYIDYFLRSEDMLEVIRKVQLGLGINCVFMVSEDIALNLKKELPSAQIYCGKEIANHVPKQILSVMVDTQFISNANYIDILKVVSTLQQHGSKILWLSDGKNSSQVVGVATLSMIVGSIARDDNLNKADLIAVNSRPIVVASILHNKK